MLTTRPLTTSPPRKHSAILTLSFSVALTSWTRITPVKSSPAGRGTPSTTVMDRTACRGDSLVTVPSTTELGAGGWGRVRGIVRVCESRKRLIGTRGAVEARCRTNGALILGHTDDAGPQLAVSGVYSGAQLGCRTTWDGDGLAREHSVREHGGKIREKLPKKR